MAPLLQQYVPTVVFGAAIAFFVFCVWADVSALLAHLLIAVGAVWAFPSWTSRIVAFIAGHIVGIALGVGAKRLRDRLGARPRDPAHPEDMRGG